MRAVRSSNAVFQDGVVSENTQTSSLVTGVFTTKRVVLPDNESPWLNQLMPQLNELTSLPNGWDGYEGRPVIFENARYAANIINRMYSAGLVAPSVVPGSDGTVQLEWHRNVFDVELHILAPQKVEAFRLNRATQYVENLELKNDFTPIENWLVELLPNAPALE